MKTITELLPLIKTRDLDPRIVQEAESYFKDHIATQPTPDVIVWAKPGENIHRIDYITYNAYLFIVGDWGENVFWREKGFQFWGNSDLSYLMQKIEASSETQGKYEIGKDWDYKKAEKNLRQAFVDQAREYWLDTLPEETREIIDTAIKSMSDEEKDADLLNRYLGGEEIDDLYTSLRGAASDYEEYKGAIWKNYNELHEIFGDDWYEISGLSHPGLHRSFRIDLQFLGLRLAMARLGLLTRAD